jgi:hypothetical protein
MHPFSPLPAESSEHEAFSLFDNCDVRLIGSYELRSGKRSWDQKAGNMEQGALLREVKWQHRAQLRAGGLVCDFLRITKANHQP